MIFPNLVRDEFCKTPIKVFIKSEKVDKNGNPQTYEYEGFCNYQSSSKIIIKDDKKTIELSGKCYLKGDIFPELATIGEGEVELFNNGIKRRIYKGSKNYNLDGSVNFSLLELM